MAADKLSPLKAARREKLLDVAQGVFLSDGLRGTTMEGIAEAAGMSKVTVYGYLGDKDAAFEAVASRLARQLEADFLEALGSEGPLADRVTAAILGKHMTIYDLVRTSAHAAELMSANREAGDYFRKADACMIAALATEIDDEQAARVVFSGALGIANAAGSRDQMVQDIRWLVVAVLTNV